jgi:hypothetical protein
MKEAVINLGASSPPDMPAPQPEGGDLKRGFADGATPETLIARLAALRRRGKQKSCS